MKLVGGEVITALTNTWDYRDCSTNCYKNDDCDFWSFRRIGHLEFECVMIKKNYSGKPIGEVDELYVDYGKKNCYYGNSRSI